MSTAFLALAHFAHGQGHYQNTRDGKTLVWNDHPRKGDEATWSGRRDRQDYARGFGTLIWYVRERGARKPQLYARFWGNMANGKFNGMVNVHSKRRTHHALFANGARITRWTAGPARSRLTPAQLALLERHNPTVDEGSEPPAPASGPATGEITAGGDQRSNEGGVKGLSIEDLWNERWPKIDLDESIRLLAWPPRSLRK